MSKETFSHLEALREEMRRLNVDAVIIPGILLCIYIASTILLLAVYVCLGVGCWQRSKGLADYSHLGNELFPAWEQAISSLGIIDKWLEKLKKRFCFLNNRLVLVNRQTVNL